MNWKKGLLILILILAAFLRLWKLDQVPVSLFGDELDVGYHAYSILKTGKDYSGNLMPLHFQSLAEWRTPLYLYSCVPTIGLFGITAWGVRLPAAFFGILGVLALYLLVKEILGDEKIALISALVLTFSPWHIQYSRAAFEVTQLLFFLLMGLYLFYRGLRQGKWLWLSAVCFGLMPWVYSTAKLFTPFLLAFLFLVYFKDLLGLKKKHLIAAVVALLILGLPMAYTVFQGGGAQRFGYISVFTDPTTEPEVGTARLVDAQMRGELGTGIKPTIIDRLIHNKFTFWGSKILNNLFEPFSTDFLFNKGDINLRHSIQNVGQFYKVEAIPLILGLVLFFSQVKNRKIKWLIGFWILAGIVPAAITRDGGKHATRLILILVPLVILISYGLVKGLDLFQKRYQTLAILSYLGLFMINFIAYQHNYWVHNPWYSERWWHAGFKEAIQSIKEVEKDYDQVVISMANEPAWIFFAAHYPYPPDQWHQEFPIGNDIELKGFGKISHTGKFYFGVPQGQDMYSWGESIDNKTLYLASEKEVKVNLILEPERTPGDLKLLKSISYPSGEPAFYLFTGK